MLPMGPHWPRWESRAAELRLRRDRLAADAGTREAARHEAEQGRARAEASTALAEERMARADRDVEALGERERSLAEARDTLRTEMATTTANEAAARAGLEEVRAADAIDRERRAAAEREASEARERLRSADARLRGADHVDLEARLGLEALHESAVVELGGLADLGIARLRELAGEDRAVERGATTALIDTLDVTEPAPATDAPLPATADAPDDDAISDDVAALERALARVTPLWAAEPPSAPAPSSIRLGQLAAPLPRARRGQSVRRR